MSARPLSCEQWRTSGGRLATPHGSVFTKEEGTGDALLLIHGFPTASWDWARIWPALTRQRHCLTLDMIGFGFSDKPMDFAYSIGAQADLCETYLADRNLHEYAIVAHDFGDTVAQELLARHNEGSSKQNMTSLVLLNGGLFPETHQPLLLQKLLAGPLGPVIARLTTYRKFAANMRKICAQPLSDADVEGMWQLMTNNNGIAVLPKLIGYMAERRRNRERWVGALQKSNIPMRLIDGLRDPISGAHMVARYRELIARPDIVELPDVGHYPQVEAPEAVAEAVTSFLSA